MKKIFITLSFCVLTLVINAQLKVNLGSALNGEYDISYNTLSEAGESTICIYFYFPASDSVSNVTFNLADIMNGSWYYFDDSNDYHYGGISSSIMSGSTAGVINLDVSDGTGVLYINTCYFSSTISWSSNITMDGNSFSQKGCVTMKNNTPSNDFIIKDYSKKTMGTINSASSAYSKAMLLLEQPNQKYNQYYKLGFSPQKISSNTSLGITSSGMMYQTALGFRFNTTCQSSFDFQFEGTTKFMVSSNGGVSIGKNGNTPPDNGLSVKGMIIKKESKNKFFAITDFETSTAGVSNCISARVKDNNSILYYSLKSANIGSNFDNQAGLVFDVKYTNSEEGVGDNNAVLFKSGWNNRLMWITGKGDVGIKGNVAIGSSTTGTHKLAVDGTIGAREIVIEVGDWSDFVFEDDYTLPSLKDVETHIKENGHLKDIPSAQEVEENGVSVGEMNAKLLQKVEELTLYIIDQQKSIERQQQEIDALKHQIKE